MWLQFGLQFNAVRRRSGKTVHGRRSSLNRSGRPRPELLMRLRTRAAAKGKSLSRFSHGLTGRYRTRAPLPDTGQDSDLRIRILTHWPDTFH